MKKGLCVHAPVKWSIRAHLLPLPPPPFNFSPLNPVLKPHTTPPPLLNPWAHEAHSSHLSGSDLRGKGGILEMRTCGLSVTHRRWHFVCGRACWEPIRCFESGNRAVDSRGSAVLSKKLCKRSGLRFKMMHWFWLKTEIKADRWCLKDKCTYSSAESPRNHRD